MRKNSEGQALVLVLLSLAVVLTLVLFILARSVTNVAITSTQEESVRAFSAAEAGVEKALVVGVGSGITQIGDASYEASVTSYAQSSTDFVYPIAMTAGDVGTTWFVSHDSDNNLICDGTSANPCFAGNSLQICWGKPGTSSNSTTTPAVEAVIYYESTPGDAVTTKIARAAFDPYGNRRAVGVNGQAPNNFAAPDGGTCQIGGVSYAFGKTFQFSSLGIPASSYNNINGLQFARIRMLYNTDTNQEMAISVAGSGSTLPSQGQLIDSTGTAGVSNRRISVFQSWPEIPSVFEFAIFSPNGLTK